MSKRNLATAAQAARNAGRLAYPAELDALQPGEIWDLWRSGDLTVHQVYTYQVRAGILFSARGEVIRA
jgi:hypothetical protein